jgi:hypothetical protein
MRGGVVGFERTLVVEHVDWCHEVGDPFCSRAANLHLKISRLGSVGQGEYSCIITASKTPGQLLSPPVAIHIVSTAEEARVANQPLHELDRQKKEEQLLRAEIERECLEQGLPVPSYETVLQPLRFKCHPQPCSE